MQINIQILSGLGYIKKRIHILIGTLIFNIIGTLICIIGYKNGILHFPSGSSASSFAVGVSWVFMWWLSIRAVKKYSTGFNWYFFFKNLIIILLIGLGFYFWKDIFSWEIAETGRIQHLPGIGFALFTCLTIFLSINAFQIREFFITIKKVRNGTL